MGNGNTKNNSNTKSKINNIYRRGREGRKGQILDMTEALDLTQPLLDQQTQAFLKFIKDSGRPELHTLPVAEARAVFVQGQARVPVTKLAADIQSRTIPAGPGGSVQIHIIRPAGSKAVLPAVMYF